MSNSKQETWYSQLGYAFNPFTIKPGFFDDEVFGYDNEIDDLVLALQGKSMNFLEGDFGLGKTSIVKYILTELKGVYRIAHISRNRSDRAFNYESLLKGANKGFAKFLGKKAKNVVLIVDETQKINRSDCEQIINLYDEGFIKSVLFIDASFKEARLTGDIKKEIGKKIITLKSLSPKDAIELVRSRLEGHDELITDEFIKKVFDKSGKNTRQFLLNMEDVCRNTINKNRVMVTKDDLNVIC